MPHQKMAYILNRSGIPWIYNTYSCNYAIPIEHLFSVFFSKKLSELLVYYGMQFIGQLNFKQKNRHFI
jgi:hypothetical protein